MTISTFAPSTTAPPRAARARRAEISAALFALSYCLTVMLVGALMWFRNDFQQLYWGKAADVRLLGSLVLVGLCPALISGAATVIWCRAMHHLNLRGPRGVLASLGISVLAPPVPLGLCCVFYALTLDTSGYQMWTMAGSTLGVYLVVLHLWYGRRSWVPEECWSED